MSLVIRSWLALAIWGACNVVHAEVNLAYVEKKAGDHVVRLPLLAGFASSCEENSQFSKRVETGTPPTHLFLTCASDFAKWSSFKAGKPQADFYPLLAVTVLRQQPGGPWTTAEFGKLKDAAHARLGDMVASENEHSSTIRSMDHAASVNGSDRSTKSYEQKLQGFFDAPSAAPSFSFVTTRAATISEAGITREVREVTAISTVYYSGEVLQLMVVNRADVSADTSVPRNITKRWLEAFNALNKAEAK